MSETTANGGALEELRALLSKARHWNPIVRRSAAGRLSRFDWESVNTPAAVGILAEALDVTTTRRLAKRALQNVLPRLNGKADRLTVNQLACFHRELINGAEAPEVEFQIQLVEALWRLRDFSARPALSKLIENIKESSAHAPAAPEVYRKTRLLAAAKVALKNLEHQAETANVNDALLRPVLSPVPDEELLRPTSSSPSERPGALLRPIHSDDQQDRQALPVGQRSDEIMPP